MTPNLGQRLVDTIRESLQIDPAWIAPSLNGFTWWPGVLRQRVFWEPLGEGTAELWRVHVRTDVVDGFDLDAMKPVGEAMRLASMSGLIRDPDDSTRLQLETSAVVHSETIAQIKPVIHLAASLQAAEAYRLADLLEAMGCGSPAATESPNGFRTDRDGMLGVIRNPVGTGGEKPSLFTPDLDCTADLLAELHGTVALGPGAVSAELTDSDGGFSSLITVSTETRHPILGNGATIMARLAPWTDIDPIVPLELNELEAMDAAVPAFGSWSLDASGALTHVAFFPNILFAAGLLPNLALYALAQVEAGAEAMLVDTPQP